VHFGKSASEAYRAIGSKRQERRRAGREVGGKGSIRERVAELKAAQSQKSELSRDQVREFLIAVIQTPAGKVDEQSRLCQSYKVTPDVREIRMPDKVRAVEQFAKLCGC
jgi:hypothetical protein